MNPSTVISNYYERRGIVPAGTAPLLVRASGPKEPQCRIISRHTSPKSQPDQPSLSFREYKKYSMEKDCML